MRSAAAKKAIVLSAAVGIAIGSVTLAVAMNEPSIPSGESSLTYEFDPQYTHVKAFEVGEKYQGIPEPLGKRPPSGVVQPWRGYVPGG